MKKLKSVVKKFLPSLIMAAIGAIIYLCVNSGGIGVNSPQQANRNIAAREQEEKVESDLRAKYGDEVDDVIIHKARLAGNEDIYGPYPVRRVVDGDTIVVAVDGVDTKVRFIGVDTAESVHPDDEKNTQSGLRASKYTKILLDGQQVYLEYDVQKTDEYGRTLAYVYLCDGQTMVNEFLVEQGLADVMTVEPNVRYQQRFVDAAANRE